MWDLGTTEFPTKELRDDAPLSANDIFNKTVPCPLTHKCWEGTPPFAGGSAPWLGTSEEQEAAARKQQPPECVWSRCHDVTCPQYSCSGSYDIRKYRPAGKAATEPTKMRENWCWENEGHMLPLCDKCLVPAYECLPPEPEHNEMCPEKPRWESRLYTWTSGIPSANFTNRPYPPEPEDAKEYKESRRPAPSSVSCTKHFGVDFRLKKKPEVEKEPEYSCEAAFPEVGVCKAAADPPCNAAQICPHCYCPVDNLLTVTSFPQWEAIVGKY